uniref:Zinc finger RING-type eukaryotic domain-containing protein n=1 Tax=Seriola lalandi dorsalis TaxID=1841481 RepID=A0A3B4WMP5_SERLL
MAAHPEPRHSAAEMAQANISVTESQFRCPICLDILKDPVSIPCGHTYSAVRSAPPGSGARGERLRS